MLWVVFALLFAPCCVAQVGYRVDVSLIAGTFDNCDFLNACDIYCRIAVNAGNNLYSFSQFSSKDLPSIQDTNTPSWQFGTVTDGETYISQNRITLAIITLRIECIDDDSPFADDRQGTTSPILTSPTPTGQVFGTAFTASSSTRYTKSVFLNDWNTVTFDAQVTCLENHIGPNCRECDPGSVAYTCDPQTGERTCSPNYYPNGNVPKACTVFCLAGPTYTCASDGLKQCVTGYEGVDCDTTIECDPAPDLPHGQPATTARYLEPLIYVCDELYWVDGQYGVVSFTMPTCTSSGAFTWDLSTRPACQTFYTYWQGSSDGLWNDPHQWASGAVPCPAMFVDLNSTTPDVTIVIAANATASIGHLRATDGRRLTIAEGATLNFESTPDLACHTTAVCSVPSSIAGGATPSNTTDLSLDETVVFTCPVLTGLHGIRAFASFNLTCTREGILTSVPGVCTDPCDSLECLNGATCVVSDPNVASAHCQCPISFTGTLCESTIDYCASSPCQNGASSCVNAGAGSVVCTCAEGFTGALCESDVDECASSPCQLGATCTNMFNAFTCTCTAGTTGTLCNVAMMECASSPCQNAGTCIDLANAFACTCASGFTGDVCSASLNECTSSPCLNGGVCSDGVDSFSCDCTGTGHDGVDCSLAVNSCDSSPCQQSATCIDNAGVFTCVCPHGFSGVLCNFDLNECASSPCENGASCANLVSGFRCACAAGFTGPQCSTNVDECSSSPCLTGTTCIDGLDSYVCACTPDVAFCVNGTLAPLVPSGIVHHIDWCLFLICNTAGNDVITTVAPGDTVTWTVTDEFEHTVTSTDSPSVFDSGSLLPGANFSFVFYATGDFPFECAFHQSLMAGVIHVAFETPCISSPCQNGATCTDSAGTYMCTCAAGYTDLHCNTQIDECASSPCHHTATCVDELDAYLCVCIEGTGSVCDVDSDLCASSPCQNGGVCLDGVASFMCSCAAGFTGLACAENIDECVSSPCQNGATCADGVDEFSCTCAAGFTGVLCSDDIDECASSPCQNDGVCSDGVASFMCSCAAGFTGLTCAENIDECVSSPCQNGATCADGVDGFACSCVAGFTGGLCSVDIDECASSPCRNGGVCSNLVSQFTCDCSSTGFTGTICNSVVDHCLSNPCQGASTCQSVETSFTCTCPIGLTGTRCDINIEECNSNPCQNGGTCVELGVIEIPWCQSCTPASNNVSVGDTVRWTITSVPHTVTTHAGPMSFDSGPLPVGSTYEQVITSEGTIFYQCEIHRSMQGQLVVTGTSSGLGKHVCSCPVGFTGAFCHVNIDKCASSPCGLNGACIVTVDGFTCACSVGFTDTLCDVNIDECASLPCQNGATCVDGVDGFSCTCAAGFTGAMCNVNLNECVSSPCQNGATCADGVDGFACSCVAGFTGGLCSVDIDECASSPCQNDGVCSDGVASFMCSCAAGFTGLTCAENIDECVSSPCQNGATCADGVDGFACSCVAGFTGGLCSVDIDECASSPCRNGGVCSNLVSQFTCDCSSTGFTGTICNSVVDHCLSNPCRGASTCQSVGTSFTCICQAGQTGTLCEMNIAECASSPCLNGATCVDGVAEYMCVCPVGFTGTRCDVSINECVSSPCQNAATCVDAPNAFTCVCAQGYSGFLCSDDIDECASSPCQNAGVCTQPSVGIFLCDCTLTAFTGTLCDVNSDECDSSPCQNGGECFDHTFSFSCNCAKDYTGTLCESSIDECASSPCRNGASCTDGVASFACACAAGYTGAQCDGNIDECSSFPCHNGAQCSDGVASFACTCAAGFTSTLCDVDIDECASSPCQNGGVCEQEAEGTYSCDCSATGYSDALCSSPINACDSSPCQGDGTCVSSHPTYSCTCSDERTGVNCETTLTLCSSTTLPNVAHATRVLPPVFSVGTRAEYTCDTSYSLTGRISGATTFTYTCQIDGSILLGNGEVADCQFVCNSTSTLASIVIDPSLGGVIEVTGLSLTIPVGYWSTPQLFQVELYAPWCQRDGPSGAVISGHWYKLSPSPRTWLKPIRAEVSLKTGSFQQSDPISYFSVMFGGPSDWTFVSAMVVDLASGKVSGNMDHFSLISVFGNATNPAGAQAPTAGSSPSSSGSSAVIAAIAAVVCVVLIVVVFVVLRRHRRRSQSRLKTSQSSMELNAMNSGAGAAGMINTADVEPRPLEFFKTRQATPQDSSEPDVFGTKRDTSAPLKPSTPPVPAGDMADPAFYSAATLTTAEGQQVDLENLRQMYGVTDVSEGGEAYANLVQEMMMEEAERREEDLYATLDGPPRLESASDDEELLDADVYQDLASKSKDNSDIYVNAAAYGLSGGGGGARPPNSDDVAYVNEGQYQRPVSAAYGTLASPSGKRTTGIIAEAGDDYETYERTVHEGAESIYQTFRKTRRTSSRMSNPFRGTQTYTNTSGAMGSESGTDVYEKRQPGDSIYSTLDVYDDNTTGLNNNNNNNNNEDFAKYQSVSVLVPSVAPDSAKALAAYRFDRRNLNFIEELGKGEFGVVLKATANDGPLARYVAVKTLHDGATSKEREEFLAEAALQASFKHDNIIAFIGVCMPEEPLLLVIEFCPHGDLRNFLRLCVTCAELRMTIAEQVKIMLEIASGMEYLGTLNFVHRDLAARNCLVGQGSVIKVADFGLSRRMGDDNYYRVQSKGKLPVRWMALESLEFRKFSAKTDVWSFGVVMWEVMTFGTVRPYRSVGVRELSDKLRDGKRLPPPRGCPPVVYELMMQCWHMDATKRPDFTQLRYRLSDMLSGHVRGGVAPRLIGTVLEELTSSFI